MRYEISEPADEDISTHYEDGIGRFGLAQARVFFRGLRQQFELLASQPEMGPVFHQNPSYRKWGYGPYIVLYQIFEAEDKIVIARMIDGRSDYRL